MSESNVSKVNKDNQDKQNKKVWITEWYKTIYYTDYISFYTIYLNVITIKFISVNTLNSYENIYLSVMCFDLHNLPKKHVYIKLCKFYEIV